MKNNYHFCTEALKDALLCYDEEDYRVVWNILAVCAIMTDIKIYCFCIMSNHIHILLYAHQNNIAHFFRRVKMKLGRYAARKYHKSPIQGLTYMLFPILDWKAFCQEVAYILRNPFKAGVSNPFSYRWSSVKAYFNTRQETGLGVNALPDRKRFSMLKSRFKLPDSVCVLPDGTISPDSFVDVSTVESAYYNSSIQFFNQLKQWNLEDIVRSAHGENVQDTYSDNEVYEALKQECLNVYDVSDPAKLDTRSLARLIRKMRARFGTSRDQLKRLLPVDDAFLDRLL